MTTAKEYGEQLYEAAVLTAGAVAVSYASRKLTKDALDVPMTFKGSVKLALAFGLSSICKHERTFYWHGWRTCVECRLCIHKVLHKDPYSHVSGYNLTVSKEDRFPKIEEIMTDMINSVTKKKSC